MNFDPYMSGPTGPRDWWALAAAVALLALALTLILTV